MPQVLVSYRKEYSHSIDVIQETVDLLYCLSWFRSYSAWNSAIQLTQPNDTNIAQKAPIRLSHAFVPPSGGSTPESGLTNPFGGDGRPSFGLRLGVVALSRFASSTLAFLSWAISM